MHVLYRSVERVLHVLLDCARWLLYLLAGFVLTTCIFSWYGWWLGDERLSSQMLFIAGFELLYVCVPLFVFLICVLWFVEAWRLAWGQTGYFEENGIRPLEALAYLALLGWVLWYAHDSIGGRWTMLTARYVAIVRSTDGRVPPGVSSH